MAVGITEINSAADFQTQISCGKLVVVDFHATCMLTSIRLLS